MIKYISVACFNISLNIISHKHQYMYSYNNALIFVVVLLCNKYKYPSIQMKDFIQIYFIKKKSIYNAKLKPQRYCYGLAI